jgi:hypothetical protein
LAQLGGEETASELDHYLSMAADNADAVREAALLDQALDKVSDPVKHRISASVCQAVCWFTQSALNGDFGPHPSRDARSDVFLKNPGVIAQAVQIFLANLLVDKDGLVLNHEIAEQRAAEYIGEHC